MIFRMPVFTLQQFNSSQLSQMSSRINNATPGGVDATRNFNMFQSQSSAANTQVFGNQQGQVFGLAPQPNYALSGAPAGRGLSTNTAEMKPPGAKWPEGAVQTAGGYTIVPEGKSEAFSVFGPGQKPGDKPTFRNWGDPHIQGPDGKNIFDYTKDGNFKLPDGTTIAVDTTSETGYSVASKITIQNGDDMATISGIDKNKPVTGPVQAGGLAWKAENEAMMTRENRDTYVLGGSNSKPEFFLERGGQDLGKITGHDYKKGYASVHTDGNQKYCVDPSLRPPMGSVAHGNQIRSESAARAGQMYANDPAMAKFAGQHLALDNYGTQMANPAMSWLSDPWQGAGVNVPQWGTGGQDFGFGAMGPFGGMQGAGFGNLNSGLLCLGLGMGTFAGFSGLALLATPPIFMI